MCNDLTHAHIVHSPFCKVLAEKMLERLIGLLDDAGDERVSRKTFLETLAKGGLLPDDPRLAEMFKQLEIYGARADVKSEPSDGGTDDASRGILISDLVSVQCPFIVSIEIFQPLSPQICFASFCLSVCPEDLGHNHAVHSALLASRTRHTLSVEQFFCLVTFLSL